MRTLNYSNPKFYSELSAFIETKNRSQEVSDSVREIIETVKTRGNDALIEYTKKFDGYSLSKDSLRVTEEELQEALSSLTERQKKCIREAIACVRSFHEKGLPKSWRGKNPHGATVGEEWYPVERVGIYIPAGSVPLVSTVVMTTTLAWLAGVSSVAVTTPAGKDGKVSSQMLAGLALCGVKEVYRLGGAHAIASMAFGTESIPAVSKVMGPGNAYVTEAQRQIFGSAGVDLLPGPSEALAIADETARSDYLAADLLAQAEHGSGREKVYYVYFDEDQAKAVQDEVGKQIGQLKHRDAVKKIWDESTLFIRVPDLKSAIEVTQFVAPEHLELHVAKKHYDSIIDGVKTAGAILCGHETPTVLGDFTAGPSHTLPTGRTGRFFSGLKITDFMRRSSVVEYDAASLDLARDIVSVFSELEDLDAHGKSLEIRYKD